MDQGGDRKHVSDKTSSLPCRPGNKTIGRDTRSKQRDKRGGHTRGGGGPRTAGGPAQ